MVNAIHHGHQQKGLFLPAFPEAGCLLLRHQMHGAAANAWCNLLCCQFSICPYALQPAIAFLARIDKQRLCRVKRGKYRKPFLPAFGEFFYTFMLIRIFRSAKQQRSHIYFAVCHRINLYSMYFVQTLILLNIIDDQRNHYFHSGYIV